MKASYENELRQKTAALAKKQEELNRVMHDVSTVSQSVCCIGCLPGLNPQAHTLQQSLSKVETEAAVERQTIKSAYKEKKHRLHDVEQLLTQARAELALAHARIEKVCLFVGFVLCLVYLCVVFMFFVWFFFFLFDYFCYLVCLYLGLFVRCFCGFICVV